MALQWNGNRIKARVEAAAKEGINATMAQSVIYAKQNHNGWITRTGAAEGSINIYQYANTQASGVVSGLWGSAQVHYFIWLELRYFTLRRSADVNYPNLGRFIQAAFRRGT